MVYLSKIRTHSYKLQFNNNRLVGSFALCLVSVGGKVVSTSSSNSWLINRDNSSIGVSNKASIRSVASSISNWSSSSINSTVHSLGSKMVSTCSSNSRLINRNNSTVGMSNEVSVQVERSSIAVANSSNGSSSKSRNSSNSWGSSSIRNSLGSKMISTSSSNSWFIKRNNSSIRMSNELGVQVKGTSIAVGSSISWGISSISGCNNWGSNSVSNTLGSKMGSTSSSNCWLINRGDSSVGMSLQTQKRSSRGHSNTGS